MIEQDTKIEFKHNPDRMQAWGAELTKEDTDIILHNAKMAIIKKKGKNEFTKKEADQIVRRLAAINAWLEETHERVALLSIALMGLAILDADPKTGQIKFCKSPDVEFIDKPE